MQLCLFFFCFLFSPLLESNLGENLTSFWGSFSLDLCKIFPAWYLLVVLHQISLKVVLFISLINSAIIPVWMTFKSLSLPDLLPSKLTESLCVFVTSLCGCLTFSWGYYSKGKLSVLLLVDSIVVRSLVQAHNLALVLDIAHALLTDC